jgi:hypothetical protein
MLPCDVWIFIHRGLCNIFPCSFWLWLTFKVKYEYSSKVYNFPIGRVHVRGKYFELIFNRWGLFSQKFKNKNLPMSWRVFSRSQFLFFESGGTLISCINNHACPYVIKTTVCNIPQTSATVNTLSHSAFVGRLICSLRSARMRWGLLCKYLGIC